jgi:hypothetical protein
MKYEAINPNLFISCHIYLLYQVLPIGYSAYGSQPTAVTAGALLDIGV